MGRQTNRPMGRMRPVRGGLLRLAAAGMIAVALGAADGPEALADCPPDGSAQDGRTLGCDPIYITRSKARGAVVAGGGAGRFERTFVVDKNVRAANEYRYLHEALAATTAGGVVTIATKSADILQDVYDEEARASFPPTVTRPMTIVVDPRFDDYQRTDRFGGRLDPFEQSEVLATENGRCLAVDLSSASPAGQKLEVIVKGLRFKARPNTQINECVTVFNGDVIFEGLSVDGNDGRLDGDNQAISSIGVAVENGTVTFKNRSDAAPGQLGVSLKGVDVGLFAFGGAVDFETNGVIDAAIGIATRGGDVRIRPVTGAPPLTFGLPTTGDDQEDEIASFDPTVGDGAV
ncbi:MAG: hypothetical protein AAGL49_12570, partial [Pseudomonadota bacterium]